MSIEALGLILTLFGLILTIIQIIKKWLGSVNPTIYFIIDENINLYQDITKDVEDLVITYKGTEISKDSYLLKAFVFYLGKEDLIKENIRNNIYLKLSDGSIIHSYNNIYIMDDFEVKEYIKGEKIEFEFDLLKNKDYFYFEAFTTIKNDISYKVSQRTAKVSTALIEDYNKLKGGQIHIMFYIVVYFFAIILSIGFSDFANTAKLNSVNEHIYARTETVDSFDLAEAYMKSDSIKKTDFFEKYGSIHIIVNGDSDIIKLNKLYSVKYTFDIDYRFLVLLYYFILLAFAFIIFYSIFYYLDKYKYNYILDEIKKYKTKKQNS